MLAPFAAAGAGAAAAGLAAVVEFFGLNKSPKPNLAGDADAAGLAAAAAAAVFARDARLPLGDATGDSAGLAAVVASAFLRVRFALGEASGDAAAEGDSAVPAVEAVLSAFLRPRCFVGSGEAPELGGDCSCAIETPASPTTQSRARIFVVIPRG